MTLPSSATNGSAAPVFNHSVVTDSEAMGTN